VDTREQNELNRKLRKLADALQPMASTERGAFKSDSINAAVNEMPSGLFELAAAEGPYERVIICRSLGTATLYIKGADLFIVPDGDSTG